MNPRPVTVIIPTFNSGPLVTAAVDSALAQTAPPARVIVIDDGSTDDTRQRLAAYDDRVRYVHQPNRGVAEARNHGLRLAEGEFVAFLDADDLWHPRKLELQLAAMAAHPDVVLLGTGTCECPVHDFPPLASTNPIRRVRWRDLAVKNHFVTSSVLVRRAALQRAGEFDTALHGPEDHDLWLRVADSGAVANLELPLTGYRVVPGSLSQQSQTMQAGMRRILRKLDQRDAWAGQWLLRRRAYGYCSYSCAYMDGVSGRPGRALADLARSFLWYPLPYRRTEIRFFLARLRMWPMMLSRLLRAGRG